MHIMIPRCTNNKPVMVKFLNKCEWQKRFNPDNKGGLILHMDGSETNTGPGAGVYKWRLRRVIASSFGSTTWYSWLKYTPLRCAYWRIQTRVTRVRKSILSASEAAIKALNYSQLDSKLV